MTELVINAPDLQTYPQRLGAAMLTVAGWLLWSYIFFPLVTLSCWLVDNDVCSQWVNIAGGYLQLQSMLSVYLQTVAGLSLLWAAWVAYNHLRTRLQPKPSALAAIGTDELCRAFQVTSEDFARCRESRYAVIAFDAKGRIVSLATD